MGAADPTPFLRDRAESVVEEGNVSPGDLGHLHKSPLPPGFMSWGRRGLQRWGQGLTNSGSQPGQVIPGSMGQHPETFFGTEGQRYWYLVAGTLLSTGGPKQQGSRGGATQLHTGTALPPKPRSGPI